MEIITQRIVTTLSEPFDVNGQKYLMTPTIGSCICQQTCGAFEVPEKVEIVRCYGCAMSKGMAKRKEVLNEVEALPKIKVSGD